jgi:flagellar biosynthesis component FlhA
VLAAYRGDDGALPIVTLSAEWEQAFADALVGPGEEKQLALAPSRLQDFIRGVRETFERAALAGDTPVLLTSPAIRPYVRSIIERFRGQTVVMSQNEIHPVVVTSGDKKFALPKASLSVGADGALATTATKAQIDATLAGAKPQ